MFLFFLKRSLWLRKSWNTQSHHLKLQKEKKFWQIKILKFGHKTSKIGKTEDLKLSFLGWFAVVFIFFEVLETLLESVMLLWHRTEIIQGLFNKNILAETLLGKSRHGIQPGNLQKRMGKPPQKMAIPWQKWIWEGEVTCEFPFQHQSLWEQKFLKRRKHSLKLFAFIPEWILEMFSPAKMFGITPDSPTLCWHLAHPIICITPPLQLYPGYNVRNIYTDLEKYRAL